jgi:hypothetical protein
METNEILTERGKRYGNYLEQTTISRALRNIINEVVDTKEIQLEPDQEDALMMICVKISRILNGDHNYADNWRDIAGYASLVADRLDGKERE